MQVCAKCGHHNTSESIFCQQCGNRLNNRCPDCNFLNLPQQKFCGNCHRQLQPDETISSFPPPQQSAPLPPAQPVAPQMPPQQAQQAHNIPQPPAYQPQQQQYAPAAQQPQPHCQPYSQPQTPGMSPNAPAATATQTLPPQGPARAIDPNAGPPTLDPFATEESLNQPQPEAARHTVAARLEALRANNQHEPHPGLEIYATASLEFMDWEQLKAVIPDLIQLDQFQRGCMGTLMERLSSVKARVTVARNGVLFASFPHETGPVESVRRAIEACLALVDEQFMVGGVTLQLRAGLDIEQRDAHNPLTSTLERSVAAPGSLVVSERVYQQIGREFQAQQIGPVPVGQRMTTFFRILDPKKAPPQQAESATVLPLPQPEPAPQAASPEVDIPVPPTAPELQAETVSPQAMPQAQVWDAPAAQAPAAAQMPAEPEAPAQASTPTMTEAIDDASSLVTEPGLYQSHPETPAPAAPEAHVETSEPAEDGPQAVMYEAPVMGVFKATRPPNLNYENSIEAISGDLENFLTGNAQKGAVIALCASDGAGKSNILQLVRYRVDPQNQRATWLGGQNYRCFHRASLPLFYWLEMVQNLLSLVFEGQPAREVKDQVSRFLNAVYGANVAQEDEDFLYDFLSINLLQPISVNSRERVGLCEDFFLSFLSTLSRRRPMVLVIEDIQYADNASLELLARLIEKGLLDSPIRIFVTHSRDFYVAGRLATLFQKFSYREIVVSDLENPEAERFLNDGPMGGRLDEFPVPLIERLLRNANGQALYFEEALRLLHLQDVITIDEKTGKYIISRNYNASMLNLPENLETVIAMRIEYLSDRTRYVLQLAAVLGEKFSVSMLMALALADVEQSDETAANEAIEAFNNAMVMLYNHGFLMPDAVNTGHFRHGVIWQVVYDTIDPELRMQLHQLVSAALEDDFNQQVTINPMLVAYHAEEGELPNRALNYWNLAGIWAAQVGHLTGMNMAMFRAMEIMDLAEASESPRIQEMSLRMHENLGAFNLEENPDLAISLLEWVFFYRKRENNLSRMIEPLGFLASAYENKGKYPEALAAIENAIELIDRDAYPIEYASMLINRMEYLFTLGRLQQARELMENEIMPVAEAQGRQNPRFFDAYLNARLMLADIMLEQCDEGSATLIEEGLQFARERNLVGLSIALQLLKGLSYLRKGQYEDANRDAETLLNQIEALEDSNWFLAQWGLLAMRYHCELEDWESASQLVLTVMGKAEEAKDYHTWIMAHIYAGYISSGMGKLKESRELIEQAIQLSSDYRFARCALAGWRYLALVELKHGNHDVAYEIAAKALEIANKPDIQARYEIFRLSLLCAECLLAQGSIKPAGQMLEPLWPQIAKTRQQPLIANCAQEIGFLYKAMAGDVPMDLSRRYLTRSVEFFLKAKSIWLELRNMSKVRRIDMDMPRL